MKYYPKLFSTFAAGCFGLTLCAGTALFDPATNASYWGFNPGAEFPGAIGGIKIDPVTGKTMVHVEFKDKSVYSGGIYARQFPAGTEEVLFEVTPSRAFGLGIRVEDANGRFFQTGRFDLKANEKQTVALNLKNREWEGAWGGDKGDYQQPALPLKNVQLLLNRAAGADLELRVDAIRISAPQINTKPFTGENTEFSAFGCTVKADWVNGLEPALNLTINAADTVKNGTQLAIAFPDMFRDKVERFTVVPGKTVEYRWPAPLELGGNPSNTYQIALTLEQGGRTIAAADTRLVGADSPDWEKRLTTAEVKESIIGTGVHFNFALAPGGGYGVWYDYNKVLPLISNAGIKWLRDDYWIYADEKGNYPQYAEFIKRLKAAKALGFKTIGIIPTMADRSPENVCRNIEAFVKATGDLIDVYEIGNEPHNFGGWMQQFPGGSWNGYEGKGKVSRWLLEHAKVTNAAADCLRRLRPDAVIIGGGCVTSANIHYLKSGISKNLNGFVDHPYNTMLVPERIAFGTKFNSRDGVVAGDDDFSYVGIVKAYEAQFKAMNRPDMTLYFTEFGFPTYRYAGVKEKEKYKFAGYSEEAQAAYIARRFLQSFTLPVLKAVIQYDFVDDFNSAVFDEEANFGVLRTDLSPKPAYFTMQRIATLFDGVKFDPATAARLEIVEQPLQRAAKRDVLLDWDENGKALIHAENNIQAHLFQTNQGLRIAAWSALPFSGEYSPRFAKLRVKDAADRVGRAVGTDLLTGKRFDVPTQIDGNDLLLTLSIGNGPLAIAL